jgi:hypothetical protein
MKKSKVKAKIKVLKKLQHEIRDYESVTSVKAEIEDLIGSLEQKLNKKI